MRWSALGGLFQYARLESRRQSKRRASRVEVTARAFGLFSGKGEALARSSALAGARDRRAAGPRDPAPNVGERGPFPHTPGQSRRKQSALRESRRLIRMGTALNALCKGSCPRRRYALCAGNRPWIKGLRGHGQGGQPRAAGGGDACSCARAASSSRGNCARSGTCHRVRGQPLSSEGGGPRGGRFGG